MPNHQFAVREFLPSGALATIHTYTGMGPDIRRTRARFAAAFAGAGYYVEGVTEVDPGVIVTVLAHATNGNAATLTYTRPARIYARAATAPCEVRTPAHAFARGLFAPRDFGQSNHLQEVRS